MTNEPIILASGRLYLAAHKYDCGRDLLHFSEPDFTDEVAAIVLPREALITEEEVNDYFNDLAQRISPRVYTPRRPEYLVLLSHTGVYELKFEPVDLKQAFLLKKADLKQGDLVLQLKPAKELSGLEERINFRIDQNVAEPEEDYDLLADMHKTGYLR